MNRNIRKVSLILACLFILLVSVSCGGASYRDDVTSKALSDAVNPLLSGIDDLDPADETYVSLQQKIPTDKCLDYAEMFQTSGVGIDEYGIFRVKEAADVQAVEAAVKAYIETAKDAFIESYAPGERPKLDNATVKIFGEHYVVYAVLSDNDKSALFSKIEEMLKK